ncbi:MAG: pyruvate kinase [Spirochaetota bacterium]|nr:pyruvate kinase [Spirochaetota bacterium]
MRKTKIVCTLGPATERNNILRQLFINGMNVARLNFSHGTHDEHRKTVEKFMALRDELDIPVGLLMDTKGPEIRVQQFEKDRIELKAGSIFTLTTDDVVGNEKIVSVTYKGLTNDVDRGDIILIDDGLIKLKVVSRNKIEIQCEVINGGPVSNNKGINVPNVSINMPYINERDRKDFQFVTENNFDFIAASFVKNASCIKELRRTLEDYGGGNLKIIAKIENREGVDNADDIIRISDGVMIARGDMGVEIPFEELPSIQKELISKCYLAGKPVITATQMLDSMIHNPRPTRAEITDVANAIYDGTSAIMLSGETSIGKYPLEALLTMSKIAIHAEKNIDYISRFNNTHFAVSRNVTNAISHATCVTAHTLDASAIISVTKSGHTAQMISKFRPASPIIATTVNRNVYWQLSLSWGVRPVLTEIKDSTDDIFDQAIEKASNSDIIKNGDLVVITGGTPAGISGTTNTLKVHIIGDVLVEGKGLNNLSVTGNLYVVHKKDDAMKDFNAGDIVVISKTTDEILLALKYASGVITEEDEEDSRAAVVGMALEIPVIANAVEATTVLKSGTVVSLDALSGVVYSGLKRN